MWWDKGLRAEGSMWVVVVVRAGAGGGECSKACFFRFLVPGLLR